jgi:two-component system, OmpR family, alkaline phosphatase synthesis response regulator PhoP
MVETKARRLLLVDDERGVVDILRVNMEGEGYEVYEANDGLEALERVRDVTPDLIVLDVMMPRMSGWEVLRRLEADPDTAGIPVVMLSVRTEEADIMRGLEQGALEYLTKPFDPLVVSRTIKMVLEELDERGRQAHRQQLIERRRRYMKPLHNLFDTYVE